MSRVILHESGGVKIDYLDSAAAITASLDRHTFTDLDLGLSGSSEILLIGAVAIGTNAPIVAIRVNGNAATLVEDLAVPPTRFAALYQISGESGAGDVEIEVSNTASRWAVGLYKLRALQNSTAQDTDDDSTGSLSFDVPARGAGIVFHMGDNNPTTPPAFAGITRDFSVTVGSGGSQTTLSGGSIRPDTAQTPLAVTITDAAASEINLAASWR
jgi:hypothetical protein